MDDKELRETLHGHEDWMDHLGNRIDELAVAMAKTQKQIEKTDAQIADTNRALKELGEKTDARINKLVGAIMKLVPKEAK
jgi:chaperonin cofactor prefoldin